MDSSTPIRPITLNPKYIQYRKDREVWLKENVSPKDIQLLNTLGGERLIEHQKKIGLMDYVKDYWRLKKVKLKNYQP